MKETVCSYGKRIHIVTSHFSILKLQNDCSQCSSYAFFRKIEEELFWVINSINQASEINSIMNHSHTLFAIADAKTLSSILCSPGNIQIRYCWGPVDRPRRPVIIYLFIYLFIHLSIFSTKESNSAKP